MKVLKFLRDLFRLSKNQAVGDLDETKHIKQDLPIVVADSENIARFIFSPINVNPKNNNLKPNFLKPPTGLDEVSVNRYDYTDGSFLKTLGLQMQNPKKEFYGLAIFTAKSIRDNKFDLHANKRFKYLSFRY